MQVRQLIEIFKVTTIPSLSQRMFDAVSQEVYFLYEDTAKEYLKQHPAQGLFVTREIAFERCYDQYQEQVKKNLTYNYYLFRPVEIERTKEKDLRICENAWGCILKNEVKHFIQFTPAVEQAINENSGSVLILNRSGSKYVTSSSKNYVIEQYDIASDSSFHFSTQYLYVATSNVKGKLTEVRSFIHENNMIRVNTSAPKNLLVNEKDQIDRVVVSSSK